MVARRGSANGKTAFVQEVLTKNPKANARAVNEAWASAGREGSISSTLVQKLRASLGLAGNLRARKPKSTDAPRPVGRPKGSVSKKRGPVPRLDKTPRFQINGTSEPDSSATEYNTAPDRALEQIETEIDRLIFSLMTIGGLPEVEEVLRTARRLLVLKAGK